MTIALPASWLLAHRLASRLVPEAPWSESELPAIPAPAENGLDDVVLPGSSALATLDPALQPLVRPLERVTPDSRWQELVRRREELRAWLAADAALRERDLARIDAVLAAPHFADPCASVGSDCRWVSLVNFARVAMAADLDAALRGDWSRAFLRAHALQLASNELLASARATVANMIALVLAHMATDHLRVLVAGYRAAAAEDAVRAELRPTLDASMESLSTVRREDVSARRAVIAECLWLRAGILPVLEDPGANGAWGGFVAPYLVDVHGTVAALDAHFVALMRWVEAPDHATRAPPPARVYASGPAWWLWNPVGKTVLDLGGFDFATVIRRLDTSADELFVSRAALRGELRALLP